MPGVIRLGLDIGTNSIGWWLYELHEHERDGKRHPAQHIDGGARIFSDGRAPSRNENPGEPTAVKRRIARGMRRRRDRYLRRRAALLRRLVDSGLMPEDRDSACKVEQYDPYLLRARGLDHRLQLPELGRALFHLNQRRGFKSNRKANRNDDEEGKIADGIGRLEQEMRRLNARTYGEFLHQRRESRSDDRHTPTVRTRLGKVVSGDADKEKEVDGYHFYPNRAMFEREFDILWQAQTPHHRDILTDDLRDELRNIIFYQRPLKEQKPGRCQHENEERLPRAHPLFQERRLYETVNALRIQTPGSPERPLTLEERNTLVCALRKQKRAKFSALAKKIKLDPKREKFNFETDKRTHMDGDEVYAPMFKAYGSAWAELSSDDQWDIISNLDEPEKLRNLAQKNGWNISEEQILEMSKCYLPEGYGRLGETASRCIINLLKEDIITYPEAVKKIYGSHSGHQAGEEAEKRLPYYGKVLQSSVIPGSFDSKKHDPETQTAEYWGRISNPTVHVGLNQLRGLVNAILERYGKPDEIVVELARDLKLNGKQIENINRENRENKKAAEERGKKLEEQRIQNNGANRMLLRLWEQLHKDPLKRCCPYTGKQITIKNLFDGSCDVDHILPFSRTLNDSVSNRVICMREANREKGNQTPFEAWGGDTNRWQIITSNLPNLPKNMQWRFASDAMDRFVGEEGFMSRQLTDTQYLSRVARQYLQCLYPEGGSSARVRALPGRLTEMLRRQWRLNELLSDSAHHDVAKQKNRMDHRHHAIDAAIVAATDQGLLQRIAKASHESVERAEKAVAAVPPPWRMFKEEMKKVLERITVSHRPDHLKISKAGRRSGKDQTTGQLHNETAYGFTGEKSGKGIDLVVTRKSLKDLGEKDIEKIRDLDLRDRLRIVAKGLKGAELRTALTEFSQEPGLYQGIRRVRLIEPVKVIPIKDKEGNPYKGYKGDSNHCIEVWEMPNGKWRGHALTTFLAHQNGLGVTTRPHPAARLVMRLYKKDAVALEHPKHGSVKGVIVKFTDRNICVAAFHEADVDRRNRDKEDTFSYVDIGTGSLQKYRFRKIGVDVLGRLTDPGFANE